MDSNQVMDIAKLIPVLLSGLSGDPNLPPKLMKESNEGFDRNAQMEFGKRIYSLGKPPSAEEIMRVAKDTGISMQDAMDVISKFTQWRQSKNRETRAASQEARSENLYNQGQTDRTKQQAMEMAGREAIKAILTGDVTPENKAAVLNAGMKLPSMLGDVVTGPFGGTSQKDVVTGKVNQLTRGTKGSKPVLNKIQAGKEINRLMNLKAKLQTTTPTGGVDFSEEQKAMLVAFGFGGNAVLSEEQKKELIDTIDISINDVLPYASKAMQAHFTEQAKSTNNDPLGLR